jgi:hypothetical protein
MLNSDSLDVMLHSACDTEVRGWNADAGILSGSNDPLPPAMAAASSSSGIVRTCGAAEPPSDWNGSASTARVGISSDHVLTQSSGLASSLCDSPSAGGNGVDVLPRAAVSRWSQLRANDEDEDDDDCLPRSMAAASSFGSSGAGISPPNGVVTLPDDGIPGEDGDAGTSPNGVVALLALPGEDGDVGISTTGVVPLALPDDDVVPGEDGEPGWGSVTTPCSHDLAITGHNKRMNRLARPCKRSIITMESLARLKNRRSPNSRGTELR